MEEFENDSPAPIIIGEVGRINYLIKTLRINANKIDKDIGRLDFLIEIIEDRKRVESNRKDYVLERLDELETIISIFTDKMADKAASRVNSETYPLRKELRALRKENERLTKLVGDKQLSFDSVEQEAIAKARTVAIFESILFAIENWATDDAPASDFTPIAQAVLFKTVYKPVMSGTADYYLDEVPFSAIEVVKRGREYVKALRSETDMPLTDVSKGMAAQDYQQWWVNDALALIYGDRDPEWETTIPHTIEEMDLWRSTDMDKTMHFPQIFDAFELVTKYGDEIRESSGLPNFTKQIMQTRLTAHE